MAAITDAVQLGFAGDPDAARAALAAIWAEVGPGGDPLHRCTLAHFLADLHDDPAEALVWDVRALDAADSLDNARAQQHHASLDVRGFYPSLHLNLADNFRRLGSFGAAQRELMAARERLDALPDDGYGATIRSALDGVEVAVQARSTGRRVSAPDGAGEKQGRG
ncbi:hypothetical protein [Rhodococcus sp. X156]|uniref:hypothetical protein n=1 Tax=Rhodococcus sp. X156 TaxID=2499145 RepID=UPI000FD82EDE|nr:hypothetical protein [Rhodococcus sp. X156]